MSEAAVEIETSDGADTPPPIASATEAAPTEAAVESIAGAGANDAEPAKQAPANDNAPPPEASDPDSWREQWADKAAAGDDKAKAKYIKRLERFTSPEAVFGSYNEMEARFSEGGLVKIPSEGANDNEIADFHKAMGVPEKPEGYVDTLVLENDAVLGEDDKPVFLNFADRAHKSGLTPQQVNDIANWQYEQQEMVAAQTDERDDEFKSNAMSTLKEEYGGAFKRKTNSIVKAFTLAPGGADINNENGVLPRLLGGRTSDGRLIGDDPDVCRWLVNTSQEMFPVASVMEGGDGTGKSVDAELSDIAKHRRENKRDYFKNETMQARERELLEAQQKNLARQRA